MDENSIPLIGEDLDLTKVPPLNQQRSVSFLNHFILRTANFVNKFSNMAEVDLMKQSQDIQNIETALNLLEAKLDSIPGLEDIKTNSQKPTQTTSQPQDGDKPPPSTTEESTPNVSEETQNTTEPDPNVITVKQDPRYAKFLKMVMVGVPKPAVVTKMMMEGLDPDLLDSPDAPAPDASAPKDEDSDNESQSLSSGDDFSD